MWSRMGRQSAVETAASERIGSGQSVRAEIKDS